MGPALLFSGRFLWLTGGTPVPPDACPTGCLSYEAFLAGFMSVKAMIMPMTASPAVG
jgi:hypothetical protein